MCLKSQLKQQSPDSCAEQRWSPQPTEYALRNSAAMNPSVLSDHLESVWWSVPPGARGWGRTSHFHYIKGDEYEFFGHTWGIIFIQLEGSLAIRHLNTWCPKVRGEAGGHCLYYLAPWRTAPIGVRSKCRVWGLTTSLLDPHLTEAPGPMWFTGTLKFEKHCCWRKFVEGKKEGEKGNMNTKGINNNTNKCQRRGWKSKLALRKNIWDN